MTRYERNKKNIASNVELYVLPTLHVAIKIKMDIRIYSVPEKNKTLNDIPIEL
jgi:hypothetical protein